MLGSSWETRHENLTVCYYREKNPLDCLCGTPLMATEALTFNKLLRIFPWSSSQVAFILWQIHLWAHLLPSSYLIWRLGDAISDERWADLAINLSLESKDAIICELIRAIHKALIKHQNLTYFSSYDMLINPSQKELCLCAVTCHAS